MSSSYDPQPAARRLAAAWRTQSLLDVLPEAERPRSVAEGYALQAALQRALGEPIAGYKLGLSSAAAMQRSGLGRPARGFMTAARVYRSGATLPGPISGPLLIEVEIAFVLARDLAPGEPPEAAESLIAEACLAFEVVRSRFRDRAAAGLPSFLGDSVGFAAFVRGPQLAGGARSPLIDAPAALFRNGRRIAAALTGAERTDALAAFRLFVADALEAGLPLEKGMLVTTGTLVETVESAEPGAYEARLDGLTAAFRI